MKPSDSKAIVYREFRNRKKNVISSWFWHSNPFGHSSNSIYVQSLNHRLLAGAHTSQHYAHDTMKSRVFKLNELPNCGEVSQKQMRLRILNISTSIHNSVFEFSFVMSTNCPLLRCTSARQPMITIHKTASTDWRLNECDEWIDKFKCF